MKFLLLANIIIFVYLLARVVIQLSWSRPAKVMLALALLLISQHYLIRLAFGQLSTPEIPAPLIIFEGLCFAALIFFFLLVLADDILALARRLAKRRREKKTHFSSDRRKLMLALAAAVPAVYGVRSGVTVPGVRSMEERSAKIPQALDGLVIAHVTDLHVSPMNNKTWTRALVERINNLEADLIFITGDILDGHPETRAKDLAPLADLRSRFGVFGCMGNHEYFSDFLACRAALAGLGINMLENSHTLINVNKAPLVIAGVTDEAAANFNLPGPKVSRAFAKAPQDAFRILLAHRPGMAVQNAAAGADMQFSGHTHGGQIVGLSKVVARFNQGFLYGWYGVGSMRLYVSSGAGLWNGFPVRLGAPSEIARIALRKT